MPETFNDANQRMADEFIRGAPARGIASVAGSIRSAAGTIGGRGNWTAGAAKTDSDAALRAGRRTGGARSAGGPVGEEGPSAGSVNSLPIQKPFDSSVPEELRIAPLEPLSFSIPRYSNIDAPFDELLTPSSGGSAGAGDNPFTISDATSGSTELILVSPGLLEIINGGFSTFVTPTLGGDPITDQTPIAAVTGVVYLEVTINAGSGIPTAAAVKNAAALPADTATLKHIQIGTITVGTDVVTVDSQDVTSDIRYHVRKRGPLQLYFDTVAGDLKVRISYGTIDGVVPARVQGGSAPEDANPIAAKYWAKSEYDEDGQTGVVSIGAGSTVPDDDETATYYLIGEVQIVSGEPTIFQATLGSLSSFRCGAETYSWGGS